MLLATALALGAAVLHAGWNFAVKQSVGDRFLALWGQFFLAGVISLPIVVIWAMPASGWIWAGLSGLVHVPYSWFLSRAYTTGDLSMVYPVARGGGAALAAIGGIVFLGDELSWLASLAIVIVVAGLVLLAGRATSAALWQAVVVAVTIGIYSVSDAHGIRSTDSTTYAFATFVTGGVLLTASGIIAGKGTAMRTSMVDNWRRYAVTGTAVVITYSMVQVAFRRAPVGYVTALRESGVVIAAIAGWRYLGEQGGRRRLTSAGVVVCGLVLLVVAR